MTDMDLFRRSVTKDDQPLSLESGVIHIFTSAALTPQNDIPPHWSRARDVLLRRTPDLEDMWASAVYKAITKQAALGWAVDDQADSQQRIKRAQDLLHSADGSGLGGIRAAPPARLPHDRQRRVCRGGTGDERTWQPHHGPHAP